MNQTVKFRSHRLVSRALFRIFMKPLAASTCSSFVVIFPGMLFILGVLRWDVHSLLSGKSYYDKQYDAEIKKLPLKYDSFDHFFTTMKPLLMIETWERVVRDLAKQERNGHYLEMKLNSYHYSQKLFCGKVEGQDDESQFTPASMSIKTCGNLSRIVTGTFRYRCVCSLTAELRKANALISSFKSPLFRILLNPEVSDFHPPSNGKELSPPISLHEQFNESQSKAIQSAFTMIVPQPRVPKICLLEGPPGTGKSKTIVGLLQTLLSAVNNGLERGILMPGAAGINNERLERRVLICAPSNGAVDELMMKIIVTFKAQVRQKNSPKGNCGDINIVRLGSDKNINTKVTQFSVKSLADRIRNSKNVQHMQAQLSLVDKQIEALFMRQPLPLHEKPKNALMMKRESIQRDLKEHQRKHQEVQRSVISQAHIVFSTLNSSCCVQLKDAVRFSGFSCIIVDEASQSTEMDSLVPLLYNCPKMVLVGDPKQLQPTVLSQRAKDLGYGRSLLERLLLCMKDKLKTPPLFLNIQYRMHPDICSFPSAYFYENLLLTDRMLGKMKSQFALTPYSVFDVEDGQEQQDSFHSFLNEAEAQLAVYAAECSLQSGVRSMAVITPYNGQRSYISHLLQKKFSQEDFAKVSVNTVDGFQGCEKDVVLLSCVRGCGKGATGVIGFLEDKHRLNVALTRAKLCFIIVGHFGENRTEISPLEGPYHRC
uniref:Senataxin n=1 Tax=Eptatretus burgeri TaxID=7764 RepID=A0A8C4PYF6_EPTBU